MPEPNAKLLTLHLLRYDSKPAVRAARAYHEAQESFAGTPGLLHAQPFATSDMVLPTPLRLGLLCAWEDGGAADAFLGGSPVFEALTREARSAAHLRLQAVRATGRWNGVTVTTEDSPPLASDEPVLAFVHGTLRPQYVSRFYRANLRVTRFAKRQAGFLGAMGVHETPLRFASLSWWRTLADATGYAYGPGDHRPVVKPYKEVPWATDWCTLRMRSLGPGELLL